MFYFSLDVHSISLHTLIPRQARRIRGKENRSAAGGRGSLVCNAKIGLFYSTTTGNTEAAAEWVKDLMVSHAHSLAPTFRSAMRMLPKGASVPRNL